MADSMKDLMNDAIKRANIGRQVQSLHIVDEANAALDEWFPKRKRSSVRAVFFRNGTLLIGCLSGAAAHAMRSISPRIERRLRERFPELELKGVQTKVMHDFPSSELW